MTLPKDLAMRVDEALQALAANEFQTLSLPYRTRIWAAMGPKELDADDVAHGSGVKRRTQLSILCVRKVLPTLRDEFRGIADIEEILSLAESILEGTFTKKEAKTKIHDHQNWVQDLEAEDFGNGVADAAISAAYVALFDMDWIDSCADAGGIDEGYLDGSELTDEEIDPQNWDASYNASLVAAGGFSLESSDVKRGEFWRWYLNEAVPKAYESVAV